MTEKKIVPVISILSSSLSILDSITLIMASCYWWLLGFAFATGFGGLLINKNRPKHISMVAILLSIVAIAVAVYCYTNRAVPY
ncbi:hypothetical protein ACVRWQ_05070 [Streptococcus phocae subsp. salmonis]|uniref:hypothetical protein n=1 Tax=Streptococcus phocae TaxID=119224 RepID=UPI000531DB1C|nr:hypothetical protein [Streptococcus phocae]KGR72323.1 hypothetical protein NX86_06895 [Streptococcus phocae subsp. salmonis]